MYACAWINATTINDFCMRACSCSFYCHNNVYNTLAIAVIFLRLFFYYFLFFLAKAYYSLNKDNNWTKKKEKKSNLFDLSRPLEKYKQQQQQQQH